MSRRILALTAVLTVALAILVGLAVRKAALQPAAETTAAIGGPFQLVDQKGATVDQELLKGKWSAVFFGFTHCPDICPTTLFELGQVEKRLGDKAKDFQTVFISVDPGRDTPQAVGEYVSNEAFPRRIVGLTGDAAQTAAAAKAYRVFYQVRGEGPDYAVDHASYTYLMGPRGQFVCPLAYDLTPEQIATKIQAAMRAGPRTETC